MAGMILSKSMLTGSNPSSPPALPAYSRSSMYAVVNVPGIAIRRPVKSPIVIGDFASRMGP
jgi:hypothetical protein